MLRPVRWIFDSLSRQFILLFLLALLAGQVIPFGISWNERKAALREAAQSEFIGRASALSNVIEQGTTQREDILRASATENTRFWISSDVPIDTEAWLTDASKQFIRPLRRSSEAERVDLKTDYKVLVDVLKEVDRDDLRWGALNGDIWEGPAKGQYFDFALTDGMAITMRLKDGSWFNAFYFRPLKSGLFSHQAFYSTVATALVLCIIGFILARLVARPLRQLASSAEALGRGEALPTLPENGPVEIRQLNMAFNRMQERLTRFVEDRTRMLAAIGHDLRTPLTTLRLRAEFVQDVETRERLLDTVNEIQQMAEATLAFAKGEADGQDTRVVDLNALVGSLCDDLAELDGNVAFEDGDKTTYRCRPDALKRAIRNLIENAMRYGGGAAVRLEKTESALDIVVEDDGPGIPSGEMEAVFAPFYRLESSRNSETGGVGLGLSIARTIARQHGGDIVLAPRNPGLRAVLSLPLL
ncbi:ATP-binding protein [Rhizobium sp.]